MSNRKPEQLAWDNFSGSVPPAVLKLWRVENLCVTGMSDVIGINSRGGVFWLENKALDDWPARSSTHPLRDSFEKGQLPFLRQWKWWQGNAFVLLRVGVDFYLLDPEDKIEEMTKGQLIASSLAVGKVAIYNLLEEL